MNEHGFIRKIHGKLDKRVYAWKIHDSYQGGVADCYYDGTGGAYLWAEYKYIALPKRGTTIINVHDALSALQQEWHTERVAHGINTCVIVGLSSTQGLILKGLEWQDFKVPMKDVMARICTVQDIVTFIEESVHVRR